MSDQVEITLVAQDAAFIATTKAAAAAMASVAAQEKKLGEAAKALGVDGKKFSQAFAKEEQKAASAKASEQKAAERAQKKAASDAKRDQRAAETAKKRDAADAAKKAKAKADYDKKSKAAAAEQLAALGEITGGTALFVAGLAAAAVGVAALTIKLSESALQAAELKENARGFFNVLTAGRGDKTLEYVDKLAGSLGVKFNEARQQFIEFRQAGLDNKQSAQLIKLAADLNTVDHSGELAKQAISRVLSYTSNNTQTRDQADASARAMALLAKQAGVAGDGTKAAAAAASTLVGAFNRLDNKQTQILETLGDRIKPSVDKAATAYANLLIKFADSKSGQRALDAVANGISGIADAATRAAPYVETFVTQAIAFAQDKNVVTAFHGLETVLGGIAAAAGIAAAPFVALGGAALELNADVLFLIGSASKAVGALEDLASSGGKLGGQLVDGLIGGIKQSAARLYQSVTDMASGVKKSFKDALGIKSPSKVFERYGVYIGMGAQRGLDRAMPKGDDIASGMIPRGGAVQIRGAVSSSSAAPMGGIAPGSGRGPIQITVQNITVPRGEDPGPWMRAAGHELGLGVQAILLGQGAPL